MAAAALITVIIIIIIIAVIITLYIQLKNQFFGTLDESRKENKSWKFYGEEIFETKLNNKIRKEKFRRI